MGRVPTSVDLLADAEAHLDDQTRAALAAARAALADLDPVQLYEVLVVFGHQCDTIEDLFGPPPHSDLGDQLEAWKQRVKSGNSQPNA